MGLLTLLLAGACLCCEPQDPPIGLTVVMVHVGQGDGLVLRTSNGVIHVVDAGPPGEGTASMLPVIDSLQPISYGHTFLSHFHDDHQGGMGDVLQRQFHLAYDRGDVRRTNSSPATLNYLAAAGARRRTIALGQVLALGGGATVRCVAVNGQVHGGGGADPVGSAQEENARSVALRLDYGRFSMWFGGDLTGGGNDTADVESDAATSCGDVDVYKVNHHGSNTSSNTNLISRLAPELAVVSAGTGNAYGHPTTTVVNRIVQAAALRSLLCTTRGSAQTIGFAALGHIRIDTDGERYRVSSAGGDYLDFFVDEVAPETMVPGTVRISELHRNPSIVPDTNGEYVEVETIGPRPVALRGLRLRDNGATVTLASNLMLVPGRPLLFQVDGNQARNGGQPLGVSLPFQSIALGDTADSVDVAQGATILDQVSYVSGFPGGNAVAAERRDLYQPGAAANFGAAPGTFGAGDRGSPGARNGLDATSHPVQIDATATATHLVLRGTALGFVGEFSVLGLALGSSPGFPFLGTQIPLNADALLADWLGFTGVVAVLPPPGHRWLTIALPSPNPLQGLQLAAAHVVLDLDPLQVLGVSAPIAFVTP